MKIHFMVVHALCAVMGLLMVSGCDDGSPDHQTQPGQGAIFINNNTSSDINVFIDGESSQTVQDFDDRAYDLNPGVYRVILDESGGDRTYRGDVDVIEGRLTVLDVGIDSFNNSDFDVQVFFRTP
jgi:hypothetical protein